MKVLFVVVATCNTLPVIQTDDRVAGVAPRQMKQGLERLGVQVDFLPVAGTFSRLNYLKACWKMLILWLTGKLRQYDLVHAHYGYNGIVARCQFTIPVLVSFMGSDVYRIWERRLAWLLARIVNRVHVPGEQMRALLRVEAHVIPYGVDLTVFYPTNQAEARQQLGLNHAKKLVLFPYDPKRAVKRADLVEQAVGRIEEAEVVVVSGKPPEVVAQYMNACDAMVMASTYEGSPVAIREALACNLPIVSVDVADVKSYIGHLPGCYICERTPDDMAAKLQLVFADGKRLVHGREQVLQLGLESIAEKTFAVYQQMVGEK